jgi:hypothetical protein
MLATHSVEARISRQLEELGCAENNFADICQVVSKSRLSRGLNGDKDFEHSDGEKMLLWLQEMQELKDLSQTLPDWKQVDQIRSAIEQRREAKKVFEEVQRVCGMWSDMVRR